MSNSFSRLKKCAVEDVMDSAPVYRHYAKRSQDVSAYSERKDRAVNQAEIQHSLYVIEKAKRRLIYQRLAVKKLSFDRTLRCGELAKDMEAVMEEKLAFLLKRHAKMIGETSFK